MDHSVLPISITCHKLASHRPAMVCLSYNLGILLTMLLYLQHVLHHLSLLLPHHHLSTVMMRCISTGLPRG